MNDSVKQFYDDLAEDYPLIFVDWQQSVRWQSEMLDDIIREFSPFAQPVSLLDCSCGIGTQAFGLAERGYQVLGTDLSPQAIAKARESEQHFAVEIEWDVADFRYLEDTISKAFDIIISCDNALPHLIEDKDLTLATNSMYNRLKPDGLLLISIRDYDRLLANKPRSTPVAIHDSDAGHRIVFQVWDWHDDQPVYTMNHFILKNTGEGWHTTHRATVYRALQRNELAKFLNDAGFINIQWLLPEDGKFFTPLVVARKRAV